MPVTAKLSRRFYEQFGDELTNELVEWFNAVDSTYRSDLRETNAANFARFDSRLTQRVVELDAKIDRAAAELHAKIDRRYTELDAKIDQRFGLLDHRFDMVDQRLDLADRRFGLLDQRFDLLDGKIDSKIDQRSAELRADLTATIAASESRMLRWMLTLWTSTMLGLVGLLVAILRSR